MALACYNFGKLLDLKMYTVYISVTGNVIMLAASCVGNEQSGFILHVSVSFWQWEKQSVFFSKLNIRSGQNQRSYM